MNHPITSTEMRDRLRAITFNATSKVYRLPELKSSILPEQVAATIGRLIDTGQGDKALEMVHAYPQWNEDFVAQLFVGNALCAKREYQAALTSFQAAYALGHSAPEEKRPVMESVALNNQAMANQLMRRNDEALDLCDQALSAFDQWPVVWNTKLGILNQTQRQSLPEAFAEMQQRWPQYAQDEYFRRQLTEDDSMIGVMAKLNTYRESIGLEPVVGLSVERD